MRINYLLLIFILAFWGCNTHKFRMQKLNKYPMESILYAGVELDKQDLVSLLESKIDEAMSQPFTKGNIKVLATRNGHITIQFKEDQLYISLPTDIEANVNAFAKAAGTLQIQFKTSYRLEPDWRISTKTEPDGFQWIKEPKAEFLGIKIPIEKLSNAAVNQVAPQIAQTIDNQIDAMGNLKPTLDSLLQNISKPILIDTARNLWLSSKPTRMGIAPLFDSGRKILSSLYSEINFTVMYDKPPDLKIDLPPLEFQPYKKQQTKININGVFPADSITSIMKEELVGLEIPYKKKKVKIEDLNIDFAGRLLRAKIKVSGAINGYIDASGAPYMNEKHTKLLINDFDIELTGSNFLMRKGIQLFKKKIQNILQETINAQIHKLSTSTFAKIKEFSNTNKNKKFSPIIKPEREILFNFEIKEGSLLLQITLNGDVQIKIQANG